MADLSEDSLPPEERVVANLGLEESAHRIGAQKTAINAAITMSVLLLMAAAPHGLPHNATTLIAASACCIRAVA